jgi:hypothetical protein
MLGTIPTNGKESELEHQIRLFADLYKDEKWSISTEARFTFLTLSIIMKILLHIENIKILVELDYIYILLIKLAKI